METLIPCICQPDRRINGPGSDFLFKNKLHHVGDNLCTREVVPIEYLPCHYRDLPVGLVEGDNPELMFKHPCGSFTRLKHVNHEE